MTSLSILDVVVRFHPYIGGVENTVLDLNRRLIARGHRVVVICAGDLRPVPCPRNWAVMRR